MSARLALNFLGPPQIRLHNEPITIERRKIVAMLAFLAVERGPQQRATVSALLWPDYDQSRAYKNLRQILWEIQKVIGEDWLNVSRETMELNRSADVFLDVGHFESLVEKSRTQMDVSLRTALLSESAKLYRHHFLSGFSLKDAQPFDDWAFAKSDELRHKLLQVLTSLSNDYCSLGQADQAIPHARRLVALDPLNETAHRLLMEIYLDAGQHNAALKQYQDCEQILRREMNLDPQPDTRELYKKIRRGEIKPVRIEKQTKTAIAPQHNLPHPIASFIGRKKEQDEIRNLIHKNRLVSLVGTGGIGKTSLALQLGHVMLQEYPNGVWFIALDSLSDPALTLQTVASVFDIREDKERPLIQKLVESLHNKQALIIFDNCEHLLDTCSEITTTLLLSCPSINVLITSREGLGIPGEVTYTMPSLPLPELDVRSFEKLTEYESIRLFAERAAQVLTSFELTQENIKSVVGICRKVDGIPLAIELAAARVNILQADEILQQLSDSFSLLTKDSRTILPRQQTLRGSIEWSWNLLTQEEQGFLRQASVFAGGWTLEAAQSVCRGDVLTLTGALVKKSLIVVNQASGRETRYRFHEMVREYAHEKCHESAEDEEIHARHVSYFLDLSKRAQLGLRGPSRVDWIERLNEELNNIRVALHHADKVDVETGLYLASQLIRYWESANLPEGDQWLTRFINRSESKDFPLARARALLTQGWLLTWLQKFKDASAVTMESLTTFQEFGDKEGQADALVSLGNIKQFMDDADGALELIHQSLVLSQDLKDEWRQANVYFFLGWDRRDPQRSMAAWDKGITLYRKVGDIISLANLLAVAGQFHVANGEIDLAEKYLDEAISLWQSNRRADMWQVPRIAKSLIASVRGDHEEAQALLEEALDSVRETGNRMSHLWVRVRMGYVMLRAGRADEARSILMETAQDFHVDDSTTGTLFALEGMAWWYAEVNQFGEAAQLIGWADATRRKIRDPRPRLEQSDVEKVISACMDVMGESAFSDAYDKGQQMTSGEAVSFALSKNNGYNKM
jgi:predicted ATPase/DNA-binding SARP family transcriptional activator